MERKPKPDGGLHFPMPIPDDPYGDEYAQLKVRIAELEATVEQLRITLATWIYLDPESEDASPPDAIAHLRKYPTPTVMGGMDWRRWKAAIDEAFPIQSQSNDKKEEK